MNKAAMREWLGRANLWHEHAEITQRIVAERGLKPSEAYAAAFDEIRRRHPEVTDDATVEPELDDRVRKAVHNEAPPPVPDEKKLVPGNVFIGKSANLTVIVEWVAKHLCIVDVCAEDAPDPEAWAMLVMARESNPNQLKFWDIRSKMLPTKAEMDHTKRVNDRGEPVLKLIAEVEAARDRAKAGNRR